MKNYADCEERNKQNEKGEMSELRIENKQIEKAEIGRMKREKWADCEGRNGKGTPLHYFYNGESE